MPPAGPAGKDPDAEILKGFHGIFKVLEKMEGMKPGLAEKFVPVREQLKSAIVEVLNKDPKQILSDEAAGEDKEPTVTGNASPQEPGPTPAPPPDTTAQVPA